MDPTFQQKPSLINKWVQFRLEYHQSQRSIGHCLWPLGFTNKIAIYEYSLLVWVTNCWTGTGCRARRPSWKYSLYSRNLPLHYDEEVCQWIVHKIWYIASPFPRDTEKYFGEPPRVIATCCAPYVTKIVKVSSIFLIFSKLNNQISVKFSLVSILRIDYVKVKLGRIWKKGWMLCG